MNLANSTEKKAHSKVTHRDQLLDFSRVMEMRQVIVKKVEGLLAQHVKPLRIFTDLVQFIGDTGSLSPLPEPTADFTTMV